MADNTRMKTMENSITELTKTLQQYMVESDRRHNEYSQHRHVDLARFDRVENQLISLHSTQNSNNSNNSAQTSQASHHPFQVRHIKLDFPRFDGSEVMNWIFRAEQFFDYYETPDNHRLTIAAVHMEKHVVPWFQMISKNQPFQSWAMFTKALEMEFGPSPYEAARPNLFKLTQQTTVADYYSSFTVLANRSEGLSPEATLDCFISGLKPDLKRDVIAQTPLSLSRAYALARLFEDKYTPPSQLKSTNPTSTKPYHFPTSNTPPRNNPQPPLLPTPKPPNLPTKGHPVKNITRSEMMLRREKGLCYYCDERFSISHKCPNRHYFLFQTEEEEEPDPPPPQITPSTDPETPPIVTEEHHLSLNALNGSARKGTMRFHGQIQGIAITILLDSGSSENFLQPRIAQTLQLPIQSTTQFQVTVGNGNLLSTMGFIEDLPVAVQGNTLHIPVYLLPISGVDLVLGVPWLQTLGPHIADYNALSLKFYLKDTFVTLYGEKPKSPSPAQFHHIKRLHHTQSIDSAFTLQFNTITTKDSSVPSDLNPDIAVILHQFRDVFEEPKSLPPARFQDHAITLMKGSNPVKVRPYRYPHSQKAQIETMVNEMLAQGIIQPSISPFSSPVLLVKKKDGSWRFCTDYRALNSITVKDSFPIPTVDELLDELHGACYFSKLDLRSGYHQILVKLEDRPKTAFRTHQGLYEWLVMPFGLSNAPASFQSLMNQVFQSLLRKSVLVFFDDILVYSPNWSMHLTHLEEVLQLMRHHQLYAKLSKCCFGFTKVDYLGHTISQEGVHMDKDKVKAVLDWPLPTNLKQLRGFLGLSGYYRRFIRNYASIAAPLTALLKKDAFEWSQPVTDAFLALQQAITAAPVLALPDFSKPFILETDASGTGIGAILSQDKHPIAYFSKKLAPSMQHKSAYVRELYAVTEAMAKFRHYILGHKFIIRTDQQSLKALTDQTIQTPEQQKWLHKFLGFDFTIEYKPGKDNVAADALSRSFFMAISRPVNSLLSSLNSAVNSDSTLSAIKTQCLQGTCADPLYQVRQDTLYWNNKVVVPEDSHIIQSILHEFHSSLLGGHAGIARTKARIASQFTWPSLSRDVRFFVSKCLVCQQAKSSTAAPAGLLQPLPIPLQIWDDVSMDFITGLPPSHGFTVIMVVVDRLSKYGHFVPLKSDFTSLKVAEAFLHTVVKLHGFPKSIVSDRDKVFTSSFWQNLFKLSGTTLSMSSAYHPQSDGQTEAINKCVEMYLRCFAGQAPNKWSKLLDWAEFWYNSSYQCSIGMTPFKVVYGRDPPILIKYDTAADVTPSLQSLLVERDETLQLLKVNLHRAQQIMKKYADSKRRFAEFQVGDMVLVKLQPYRQHSLALHQNQKLGLRYFGPFPVIQRIGLVAYKLLLPPSAKIHPVFHIVNLKPCKGDHTMQYLPLPLTTTETGPVLHPEDILQSRTLLVNGKQVPQVLIKWSTLPASEATWENWEDISNNYPNANLD